MFICNEQRASTLIDFPLQFTKIMDLRFSEYANQIKLFENEFERRFLYLKRGGNQFSYLIDIENVDDNLQVELIEIQCDLLLEQKISLFFKAHPLNFFC